MAGLAQLSDDELIGWGKMLGCTGLIGLPRKEIEEIIEDAAAEYFKKGKEREPLDLVPLGEY